MQIAIPIYDGFTALDAVGPYSVLHLIPDVEIRWVGEKQGPARDEAGTCEITADGVWEDCPNPDILVVPGGSGNRHLIGDERLGTWLRGVHETSLHTTSVCTGSLLLAGAGILDGVTATTHWLAMERLEELGAVPSPERVVERRKIITSAGVSSGIDMSLRLAELIHGPEAAQVFQLAIEYDPQPPFDAGSPDKAPRAIVDAARAGMASWTSMTDQKRQAGE